MQKKWRAGNGFLQAALAFVTLALFSQILPLFSQAIAQNRLGELHPVADTERLLTKAPAKAIGVSVIELSTGKSLLDRNANRPLKPASVLKVLTSAAVLDELGLDYRFKTTVSGSDRKGGSISHLAIRGGGATDLTIESAWILARRIRLLGINRIGTLELDDTLFDYSRGPSGQRAYEAGSSALSFNFNSIAISICPSAPGSPAVVSADPWEAGAVINGSIKTVSGSRGKGFAVDEVKSNDNKLHFRVSGEIGSAEKCRTVYRSVKSPIRYFGAVFPQLLEAVGVQVSNVRLGQSADSLRLVPLFEHESKPMSLIVRDLNHYSNNFLAEQLLYALGGAAGGVWNRDRGAEKLGELLVKLGIRDSGMVVVDGSGLSHDNRLSAAAITKILRFAASQPQFSAEFSSSLSVGERSGTLRARNFTSGSTTPFIRAKTGSLTGVSTLAGYIVTRRGTELAFAILLNEIASKDQALAFEEQLVRQLYLSY